MKTQSLLAALSLLALLAPSPGFAQTASGFGRQGTFVIGVDSALFNGGALNAASPVGASNAASYFSFSPPVFLEVPSASGVSGSGVGFGVAPTFDYFVTDGLSLGGQVGIAHIGSSGAQTTYFGVAPRVGYNIGISEYVSVWPRVSLSISHTSMSIVGSPDETASSLSLDVFIPFIFQLAPHFFAGIGPRYGRDLINSFALDGAPAGDAPKVTTYGIGSTFGGWI